MTNIYYEVRIQLVRYINANEIDFIEVNKQFENESPIKAREAAFEYYQNYIDVLLEGNGKRYVSDKQARIDLKPYFTTNDIEAGNANKNQKNKLFFKKGIGVFLGYKDYGIADVLVHGMGEQFFGIEVNDANALMTSLVEEMENYKENDYETEDREKAVLFCNSDEWEAGYLGDGEWKDESYKEPCIRNILETPFDWTGYDEPYWWVNAIEMKEESQHVKSIEEYIAGGEGNQVEFKPALLFNFKTQKAGISVKGVIAKAICSFLNANGGFLFIGVDNDGNPQGLDADFSLSGSKNPKDYFLLEFDQMLEYFLSFSVKSNVLGEFYQVNDKDIFVITVSPSRRRPIFVNGQNGKEFYVRGTASSRLLTDIEEITNYCLEKWGME